MFSCNLHASLSHLQILPHFAQLTEKESKGFQYEEPGSISPDAVTEGISGHQSVAVQKARGCSATWTASRSGLLTCESLISRAVEMINVQREVAAFLFNRSSQKAALKFTCTYNTPIAAVHCKAPQLLTGWFSVAWEKEKTERVLLRARGEERITVLVIFIVKHIKTGKQKMFTVCIFLYTISPDSPFTEHRCSMFCSVSR